MQILALDVGTSSVKAAVLDVETANPVGSIARVGYELDHPTPEAAEVPPPRLWAAFTSAARQAMRGFDTVAAVGLSCMMPSLILLDAKDRPLAPIWTHLDRRARAAARQVWAGVGEEFLATTGNRPLPGGISAVCYRQLLAIDPYLIREARWYLHANAWLGLRLTGERGLDRANASCSGLYNTMTDQRWSPRWCDFFNVELKWLPRLVCGSETLGTLLPAVAAELSVPPGVPVKLGTADTSSAMLAANIRQGELVHSVGTTQVLATIVSQPVPDAARTVRQLGVGGTFIHVTHNPIGGAALEWMHSLCFRDQPKEQFFSRTIEEALSRQTRVTLDPPHLGGDRLEIEAHRAAFRDLTLSTDPIDLLAALLREMERQHHKAAEALGQGKEFRRIVLTGRGSEVVRRLLPEYAGVAVEVLDVASLRGVAHLFRSRLA
jgi:sugar (pentulose or hexulose) kinase